MKLNVHFDGATGRIAQIDNSVTPSELPNLQMLVIDVEPPILDCNEYKVDLETMTVVEIPANKRAQEFDVLAEARKQLRERLKT